MSQVDSPELVATVRTLFHEYEGAIATDLEYQGFASEVAALPAPYAPPLGALFVAHVGRKAAGCIGLKPLDAPRVGEMKRLYVRPAYRGAGLGERLVVAVIEAAQNAGYRELRLDTLAGMASAQALYRRLGFSEIPPYNSAHLPGTLFYSRRLSSGLPTQRTERPRR